VTPAAHRQVSEVLTTEHRFSVRRARHVAGLARAAWYQPLDPTVRDAALIDVLQGLVAEHGRWGFRKCYDRMRLDGHRWNHKRVRSPRFR
jgi:putative transposase